MVVPRWGERENLHPKPKGIDRVKREKVPVVLYIELSNHKVADAIAEATGTETAQFNTCHNISAKDFEAGESYLSLMRANVDILREALH